MKSLCYSFFSLALFLLLSTGVYAQCTAPAAQPSCPSAATLLPSGNTNVGANSYYYSGSGVQSSTIRIANGDLTVCSGTLNLSFNLNAPNNYGTITVLSGASLFLNAYELKANNMTINNYGTISVFGTIDISGGSTMTINNAAGATLSMYNTVDFDTSNSYNIFTISNFGTVNATGASFYMPLLYSNNLLCMGENAVAHINPTQFYTSGTIQGTGSVFSLASGATKACVLLDSNQNYTAGVNFAATAGIRVSAPGSTNISGYGSATIYLNSTGCSYALPLTLLSFEASPVSSGINEVAFSTADEKNMAVLAVEKSVDGISFSDLGSLQPKNTTQTSTYSILDNEAATQTYYRLKMIDIDGSASFSQTVLVKNSLLHTTSGQVSIYPNPASGIIRVHTPVDTEQLIYSVLDLTGKQLFSGRLDKQSNATYQLSVDGLAPGSYLMLLQSGSRQWHCRFVKQATEY